MSRRLGRRRQARRAATAAKSAATGWRLPGGVPSAGRTSWQVRSPAVAAASSSASTSERNSAFLRRDGQRRQNGAVGGGFALRAGGGVEKPANSGVRSPGLGEAEQQLLRRYRTEENTASRAPAAAQARRCGATSGHSRPRSRPRREPFLRIRPLQCLQRRNLFIRRHPASQHCFRRLAGGAGGDIGQDRRHLRFVVPVPPGRQTVPRFRVGNSSSFTKVMGLVVPSISVTTSRTGSGTVNRSCAGKRSAMSEPV